MITVGVDLAAQPKNTGLCVVRWTESAVVDVVVEDDVDDDRILEAAAAAARIGVDAPFGWPRAFVDGVVAHTEARQWPISDAEVGDSRVYRLRETDLWVRDATGQTPLSVSTDRIGVAAIRCARLLARWTHETESTVDRSGVGGPWLEVYPKAALRRWGLPISPYKRRNDEPARKALVEMMRTRIPWLPIDHDRLASSHDLIDAVLCALIARAAALGLTSPIPESHTPAALVEGWIHLPEPHSLDALVDNEAGSDLRA